MSQIDRRSFVAAALGSATSPWWPALSHAHATMASREYLQPFALSDVRLLPGPALDALQVNRHYLMSLDPDRLLHMFRITAGLPSSAQPLGGWEAPDNELRGHFTGHYLSACALLAAQTGDEQVRKRGDLMVAELRKCQDKLGSGYLSAFPEELFDRLLANKPAWAPFYTIHKIMAGLLDTYTLGGNEGALEMVIGMAKWTAAWVRPIGEDAMARVLEREYGGMNEVLYNLGAVTKDARWRELGHRFDHERVFAPLAAGRDELQGMHVNTTIPKVIGAARAYELEGDPRFRNIADYFWHTVTERRTFCTGGTSSGESWNTPPGQLAKELSGYTQECCVTYNMQKLTRHVFSWTADPLAADYYERTFYNGILGVQHPADGDKLYYVPLQSGFWKLFGTPLHDFWCCTGSMAESFAKLGDSIWFRDERGIYVNLFVPSTVTWREKGLRLAMETKFPESDVIRLRVSVDKPLHMPLRIRVPAWTDQGSASLNRRALETFSSPGSYLVIERRWNDGDVVELRLPMRLHYASIPDDPSQRAVMFGPIVLAGRLGKEGLTSSVLRAGPTRPRTIPEYTGEPVAAPQVVGGTNDPSDWLQPIPGKPLEFRSTGQSRELILSPLNRIFDERYAVYWKV